MRSPVLHSLTNKTVAFRSFTRLSTPPLVIRAAPADVSITYSSWHWRMYLLLQVCWFQSIHLTLLHRSACTASSVSITQSSGWIVHLTSARYECPCSGRNSGSGVKTACTMRYVYNTDKVTHYLTLTTKRQLDFMVYGKQRQVCNLPHSLKQNTSFSSQQHSGAADCTSKLVTFSICLATSFALARSTQTKHINLVHFPKMTVAFALRSSHLNYQHAWPSLLFRTVHLSRRHTGLLTRGQLKIVNICLSIRPVSQLLHTTL